MYPAHPAHIAFCTPFIIKTTGRTGISRSHIYSKEAPPPETPGLQGARQRVSDRWYAPPAAYSLKHSLLLRVNPYSRLTAAVNQIISIPHGRKPVGQQTYLIYMTCTIGEGERCLFGLPVSGSGCSGRAPAERGSSHTTSTRCPDMSAGMSWNGRSGLPRRKNMFATWSAPSPTPSSSDTTCSGQPWRMTAASRTRPTAHQYLPLSPGNVAPRSDGCAACIMPIWPTGA